MNKKLLSVLLSLTMISSVSYASETKDSAVTSSDNLMKQSQDKDITPEYGAMSGIAEEFMEETEEVLPLEFEEPDKSKSDRFIVRYKASNLNITSTRLTDSIKKMKSVSDIKDIAGSNGSGFILSKAGKQIKSIELNEKVDIEEFTNELMSKNVGAIEYVQPDYCVDLSAFMDDERSPEAINDIASESENTAVSSDTGENEVTIGEMNDEPDEAELEDIAVVSEVMQPRDDYGTVVALIDTGVDITNTMLSSHIYVNAADENIDADNNGYTGDINGWDFYNDDPNVYNPDLGLEQAHGTLIAGVIAETAPNSKILPLKVFENGTAYTSDIIEAIEYADSMGADIVNCSWGCTDENRALKEAMEQADMTFVCAVGNNRIDLEDTPIYPACYDMDNIVSVTSVNADGGLSYFSNYNNVDIAALGRNVEGIFPGGDTGVLSGTSMSAGYVSGALASIYTDAEESVARLYNTSDKLLNLQNAVTDGRRLNLSNLLNNISSNEVIDVNPAEDFNTEGYNRTPAQSWELFTALDNISVKAGREFIAVLKADGSVWTWGKNNYGQLGNGTFTNTAVPQMVSSISNVAEIAAGEYHVVIRTNAGTVFSWGRNYGGCLGNGTTTNSNVPVAMTNGVNAISVAAGSHSSYMINSDYELYACGYNTNGQVGDGTTISKSVLTRVSISEDIVYVSGFAESSYAITETGKLYSWGCNGYGRLGDGTTTDRPQPMAVIDSGVAEVSMGFFTAIALKEDGTVYEWGYGTNLTPTLISGISGCSKVVGSRQAQFIMQGNTIKARGMNTNGALGVGDTSWHNSWAEITGTFVDFDITEFWGAAIGTNGCIYTWGIINADTGEYVTAPQKLSSVINDFAADDMDNATVTTEGETHGNLISTSDVDYYKFTPAHTAIYSIYSLSALDLVCKIYIKNANGTYTLKFSNDDSNGIMGGGNHDFFLSKPMIANTDYYIYVYPYGGNYEGEYSLYIQREDDNIGTGMSVTTGSYYNLFVNVNDVNTFTNRTITVTYDSAKMQLIDGCIFTPENNITVGSIAGTNVQIISVSSGELVFKVTYSIPSGKKISGPINVLKFKALANGYANVTYRMNDLS